MDSVVITTRPVDEQCAQTLQQAGISPTMARLFAARGVLNADQTSIEWKHMIPPSEMKNCSRAAVLLADAIDARKKIMVVADYDCDGATACTIAVEGLRMFGADVDYMVPNRFETGYGLSPQVIDVIGERFSAMPDLIVTVDNGIASVEGVEYAKSLGIDVLVTDHHLPGDVLPDALAIVNPNQPGCNFPSKSIAGCGVIFYVLMALRARFRELGRYQNSPEPRLTDLIDLVAVGTVADVVKLDDNNRILVQQGLKRIRRGIMHCGLKALFEAAGADYSKASTMDLGFKIGPRLNAAGRLADMSIGISCLLSTDPDEAASLATQLSNLNQERRRIEETMSTEALQAIDAHSSSDNEAAISVFHDDWHQGVVGILASRLKEKFWKPVIAFAPADDAEIRGSGRSVPDVHLRDTLDLVSKRHPDLILKFGGHAMAAGLSIRKQDFEIFRQAFMKAVADISGKTEFKPLLETDGHLPGSEMTVETAEMIEDQAWGTGFPYPCFMDTFKIKSQRILKEKHSKLLLEKDGVFVDAIWFNHNEDLGDLQDFVYEIGCNRWQGRVSIQLIIRHAQEPFQLA